MCAPKPQHIAEYVVDIQDPEHRKKVAEANAAWKRDQMWRCFGNLTWAHNDGLVAPQPDYINEDT